VRFIAPVTPGAADGLVAEIYDEIKHDFALLRDPNGNSPFMVHSAHPELLAAFWSLLYETVLVEAAVSRADKEAIAATVSRINDCPFCVGAHALLGGVAGQPRDRRALLDGVVDDIQDVDRRELVAWAAATREPASEIVRRPPFTRARAPEVIGTAVGFHYVNRVVEVFQGHEPMNAGPAPLRPLTTAVLGRVAARAMRRRREPGRTLDVPPAPDTHHAPSWASASPHIAAALTRFAAIVELAGEAVLSTAERACVTSALEAWEGTDPPLGGDWLEEAMSGLDGRSLTAARLCLLAALAPHRVDDDAIKEFKRARPRDRDLFAAVAWSAFAAAARIGSWLEPTSYRDEPGLSGADGPSRDASSAQGLQMGR
jgi:AhpD family alkylhydroperoxidase